VFSTSGIEGTIRSPKLTTGGVSSAEIARVQAALADIHTRHTDERRIIVMADATVNMQLVTELLAAVRATPDGGKLFTDVMLSAGFE
jgi:biopolymer transport protein ExbD